MHTYIMWFPKKKSSSTNTTKDVNNKMRKLNKKKKGEVSSDLGVTTTECPQLSLIPSKSKYQIAIVACGCFWNPQLRFSKMNGIKRVVAGYTGGQQISPTFKHLQDHTLALFIEYNPQKVSYLDVLQMWYDNDYPWEPEPLLAHRSALFVLTKEQDRQAHEFVNMLARSRPNRYLYVDIESSSSVTTSTTSTNTLTFYQAEECQQNYIGKQIEIAKVQLIRWANADVPSGLFPIAE